MTPPYVYALVAVGWLFWITAFAFSKRASPSAASAPQIDKRARWGILLQALGYALLWQGKFWMRAPPAWEIALGVLFLAAACVFAWTGARALGKQWRFDAGLNADHDLVRSGPYRLVRHPIYASMLFLLLGTGFLLTPLWLLAIATALLIAGNEIRVRIEERLLRSRFGDEFESYRKSVPAYLPFIK